MKYEVRLANMSDLPQLKTMYDKIIFNMNCNNICIWDEIYPCEFFHEDIEKESLYVLTKENEILGAFALYPSNVGEAYVKWKNAKAKALYIDRFGVDAEYSRQGLGGAMLKNAIELASRKGADFLRLFVVDINKPAINLYLKNGFKPVDGIYEEIIGDIVLRENGFEIEL